MSSSLKIVGILMAFLLVPILIVASPWRGNHRVKYECKSFGTSSNNNLQTPKPVIEKLEGQEKDNAVSRALNLEDFKLVNSILINMGYRPVLDNSSALRMKKNLGNTSVEYLVVEIDFEGDPESRPVVAIVFLEPYEEAYGFRLDYKRNLLELLVKASNGKTSGLPINDYGVGMINRIPPIMTQNCNPCEVPVFRCYQYNLDCIRDLCLVCFEMCGGNVGCLIPCFLIWCGSMVSEICCSYGEVVCEPCQGGNCYMAECYGCPGC